MTCTHDPRRITWTDAEGEVQEAVQTPSGSWTWVKVTAGGCAMYRLDRCPGCGVELWGRPRRDRRSLPGQVLRGRFR